MFAPLVAQQTPIRGIIAYGTIGSNFIEYLLKTRRTIAEAYNMSPEETDALVKGFCECSAMYFAEKLSTKEAADKKKVCGEYLSIFDLRSRAYNDELYDFNIPHLWKNFTGKALIIWGGSDYISSQEDHDIVAKSINYYHPGHAQFMVVPGTEHGMNLARNFQEAQKNSGKYNPELSKTISNWLTETN